MSSSTSIDGKIGSDAFWVYHHPACEGHYIKGHPERPERPMFILEALRNSLPDAHFEEAPQCTDDDILLYHSTDLLANLKEHCDDAEQNHCVQRIDGDTAVMARSRDAIYHAAGSVIAAVDGIYSGKHRSAFCCVRPPGHHATRSRSMGFCFVNNAAIGARYAQTKYGVGRVAVLDFDVHHGNGTEEGFIPDETLFYGSTHEKDNYPGTGAEPRQKGTRAVRAQDRRIVNRYLEAGQESKSQFRLKWAEIIDEMEQFSPEFIIISAGFDAHSSDPLGGCNLLEEDFAWATEIVMRAAVRMRPTDPVPCVSVLEGGYNLKAIALSAVAHCSVLKQWPVRGSSEATAASAEAPVSTPPKSIAVGKEMSGLWTDGSDLSAQETLLLYPSELDSELEQNRIDLREELSADGGDKSLRDVTETIFKISIVDEVEGSEENSDA